MRRIYCTLYMYLQFITVPTVYIYSILAHFDETQV